MLRFVRRTSLVRGKLFYHSLYLNEVPVQNNPEQAIGILKFSNMTLGTRSHRQQRAHGILLRRPNSQLRSLPCSRALLSPSNSLDCCPVLHPRSNHASRCDSCIFGSVLCNSGGFEQCKECRDHCGYSSVSNPCWLKVETNALQLCGCAGRLCFWDFTDTGRIGTT
jgi:hypothetical protein